MTQLKQIDPASKSFTANGKEYFLEPNLSIERWKAYEKLTNEAAFSGGFEGTWKTIKTSIDLLNKQKWVDAAVLLKNQLESIVTIDTRVSPVLALCALFMNTKEEDRRMISDALIDEKVNDWTQEGIQIDFFMVAAANIIRGFVIAYEEISQSISDRNAMKI